MPADTDDIVSSGVLASDPSSDAEAWLSPVQPDSRFEGRRQQIRHDFSRKNVDTPVAARYLRKTASDHEMMQQLMRRRARKVSQT
ncbi:hypothetical protein WJX79_010231 [Trebouxia sp. C0005]